MTSRMFSGWSQDDFRMTSGLPIRWPNLVCLKLSIFVFRAVSGLSWVCFRFGSSLIAYFVSQSEPKILRLFLLWSAHLVFKKIYTHVWPHWSRGAWPLPSNKSDFRTRKLLSWPLIGCLRNFGDLFAVSRHLRRKDLLIFLVQTPLKLPWRSFEVQELVKMVHMAPESAIRKRPYP